MSEAGQPPGEAEAHAALRAALLAIPLPHEAPEASALLGLLERAAEDRAALAEAMTRAVTSNSFEATARGAVAVVLAAETATASAIAAIGALGHLRGVCRATEGAARAALGEAMEAGEIAAVRTEHHEAAPHVGPQRVEVIEPDKLPARFWRAREPEPDKSALAVALRRGPVPGARLVDAPAGVRISNRRGSRT